MSTTTSAAGSRPPWDEIHSLSLSIAQKRVDSVEDAKDIASKTVGRMVVIEARVGLDDRWPGLVEQVTIGFCNSHFRARKRRPEHLVGDFEEFAIVEGLDQFNEADWKMVFEELSQLMTSIERSTVERRRLGFSNSEIATQDGKTESAVTNRLTRLGERLRDRVGGLFRGDE